MIPGSVHSSNIKCGLIITTIINVITSYISLLQAQVLRWNCFTRMPHIYNTELWTIVRQTLDVIVSGIKVNVSMNL